MRGKAFAPSGILTMTRITPAYAGKRVLAAGHTPVVRDHPRLCGEKVRQSRTCGSGQGSPPPMRGKDRTFLPLCRKVGITPAYAGKSDRDFVAVHKFIGSPPPMRGKETPA